MSDNDKEINLIITLKPDGSINVNGPIQNKILSLGMLEIAKDLILKLRVAPTILPVKDLGQFKLN